MARFKPYFEIDIPKEYRPDERRAIAAEIIDLIITRTESGLDKNNIAFGKYSKKYAIEKGQTNVDLTFSGQMLSEIKLLMEKSGKIRIGINNEAILGKVEGNVLGTYGNSSAVTRGRDFLGIRQEDLNRLLENYPVDDKEERTERVIDLLAADIVARNIVLSAGFQKSDLDE